jgi:hypothetical protein
MQSIYSVRAILAGIFLTGALMLQGPVAAQDFGDFDPFEVEPFSPPDGVTYIDDPTSQAPTEKVFSFNLPSGYCSDEKYGDGTSSDCTFNSSRSQMVEEVARTKENGTKQPAEAWYGFSVYFPTDFPYGTKQTKGHYDLAYWHNDKCPHLTFQNFAGNSDILSLGTNTATGGYDCRPGPQLKVANFADLVGKWNRFEIYVKWSEGDNGEAKVYLNGEYAVQYKGPTLTAGLGQKNYFKFGVYLCCTEDVKKIVGTNVLYAAVKRSETRAGLFVEEDREALRALQERLNALGCDVGTVDGVSGKRTREMAVSCRAFPEGILPVELSASTVRDFLEQYQAAGVADLPPGKPNSTPQVAIVAYPADTAPPTADLVATTYEVQAAEAQSQGGGTQIVSDISARIKKLKELSKVDFVVTGQYNAGSETIYNLQLLLADEIDDRKVISSCGPSTITYPDGSIHAAINFRVKGGDQMASNAKCLIENLPKKQASAVKFLAEHFSDIAVGMVKTGSVDLVQHEGLRSFLGRVARGEIKVGVEP